MLNKKIGDWEIELYVQNKRYPDRNIGFFTRPYSQDNNKFECMWGSICHHSGDVDKRYPKIDALSLGEVQEYFKIDFKKYINNYEMAELQNSESIISPTRNFVGFLTIMTNQHSHNFLRADRVGSQAPADEVEFYDPPRPSHITDSLQP